MKKYLPVNALPVSFGSFIFLLVNIFWAATCLQAVAEPAMPTLLYKDKDYTDQQFLKLPLPIENNVSAPGASPDIRDVSDPLRLSLFDAVGYTIQNNKDIQYFSYNPPQAIEDLAIANSVYDASMFESLLYNSTERPVENILDVGSEEGVLFEDTWTWQIGVKKPLPTGGMLSLYMDTNSLDSSSDAVIPNPQKTARLTAQIRQSLLKEFGDQSNRATIEIASLNIEISTEEFRSQVSSVLENVATTYWQLFYDRGYEEIRRESLAMAEEVHRWEKTRLEQGIANPLDVDQAEAAVGTRKLALDLAGNKVRATMKYLHQIMGFPFIDTHNDTPDIIPIEPPRTEIIQVSAKEALEKALELRPEIISAQKASESAEIKKKLARHKLLPQLDAKASYTLNSLDQSFDNAVDELFISDKNTWAVGLEFEYPLGNNKASAEYRKSVLGHKQALKDVVKTSEMIRLEVVLAVKDVSFWGQKLQSTREVQKTLEHLVEGKRTRFEISQIDNDELLYSQNLLTDAKIQNLNAIVSYNLKLFELSKAEGTLLEYMGVTLQ
jgi:outer membrane protein TolC